MLVFLRIPVVLEGKKAHILIRKRQICFFPTANLGESTMAISETVISKTTDNWKWSLATQTRSTCISESMTYIRNSNGKPKVFNMVSRKTVSLSISYNDRQLEIAAKTGNNS